MSNKETLIEVLLEKEKIAAGSDQTVDVLVRIVPPAVDTADYKRPKLNIGIALDRSGSMGGSKMAEAREAAKYCINNLLPADRFSAVIFDDQVDVLFTNQLVTDREYLTRGIDRIAARNSTALHQGWATAGFQVSEKLDGEAINRVLLITDGQANVGETRVDRIVEHARETAARGVSTTTIGIGDDFNEDLLMPMAEAGQGNAWHVQEPQDMVKIFETELKGLVSQVGHGATLEIRPAAGVTVAEVLNDFERDASGRYILPNLRAGAPLDVVVRLRVPAHAAGTEAPLAEFTLAYLSQDSNLPETVNASFAASFDTPSVVASLPENLNVQAAIRLLMNARANREAMALIDRREFVRAKSVLTKAADMDGISFALRSVPSVRDDAAELNDLASMLDDREKDLSTRKRLSYRREQVRKSKEL